MGSGVLRKLMVSRLLCTIEIPENGLMGLNSMSKKALVLSGGTYRVCLGSYYREKAV